MHLQAVVCLAALLAASVTTQRENSFWWHASIDAAHSVASAELPTFVVYGDQPGLDIAWTFKNDEGAESIRINPSAFRTAVVIRARQRAQAIETVLEWSSVGRMIGSEGGELAGALGPQQLAPGDLIRWNSILRRADGLPWRRGEYELRIDMSAPVASLISSGKPYAGQAQLHGRGAEQTISTMKYEVTGRGGKGRELLQRGQFTRVVYPIPDALQGFGE